MTPNRTHLAEQVLELILDECRYWQHKDEARQGNFAILYAAARELVDKAQSAPEPVSREAVEAFPPGSTPEPGWDAGYESGYNDACAQINAPPSHDAELVELLHNMPGWIGGDWAEAVRAKLASLK